MLAAHHQRQPAEEDPATTFTTAEARDWIGRAEMSIVEFRSVEPGWRRAFAFHLLLYRPSGGMTGTGEAAVTQRGPWIPTRLPGNARRGAAPGPG